MPAPIVNRKQEQEEELKAMIEEIKKKETIDLDNEAIIKTYIV